MSLTYIGSFTANGNLTISNIPQDYDDLILYITTENNRISGTGRTEFRLNDDTGLNYGFSFNTGSETSTAFGFDRANLGFTNSDAGDNKGDLLVMTIPQYTNNNDKMIATVKTFQPRNSSGYSGLITNRYVTNNAINKIAIFATSGTMTQCQVTMYGRI